MGCSIIRVHGRTLDDGSSASESILPASSAITSACLKICVLVSENNQKSPLPTVGSLIYQIDHQSACFGGKGRPRVPAKTSFWACCRRLTNTSKVLPWFRQFSAALTLGSHGCRRDRLYFTLPYRRRPNVPRYQRRATGLAQLLPCSTLPAPTKNIARPTAIPRRQVYIYICDIIVLPRLQPATGWVYLC